MKLGRNYRIYGTRTVTFELNELNLIRIQSLFDELCVKDTGIQITIDDIVKVWNGDEEDDEKLDTLVESSLFWFREVVRPNAVRDLLHDVLEYLVDTEPFETDDDDCEYEVENDFID